MTINQMMYFQTVAREGHMGRSAEKLLIAQPSLSVSMMKLEEELGVTLFDRHGHSLVLTSDGKVFLRHVNRVLEDYRNALEHMSRLAAEHERRIAVGCVAPVFYEYLPEKTALFFREEKNRDVKISFDTGITSELIEDLKREKYDFILCSEARDSEIEQVPIIQEPLVLIVPEEGVRGWFWAAGGSGGWKELQEKSEGECGRSAGNGDRKGTDEWFRGQDEGGGPGWEEISRLPLIGYDETSAMDQMLKDVAAEEQTVFRFSYRLPDEQSIAAFVERGLGCAIVPDTSVLKKYSVKRILLPRSGYCRKICLTVRKGHKSMGAAGRFAEFLAGAII